MVCQSLFLLVLYSFILLFNLTFIYSISHIDRHHLVRQWIECIYFFCCFLTLCSQICFQFHSLFLHFYHPFPSSYFFRQPLLVPLFDLTLYSERFCFLEIRRRSRFEMNKSAE